MRFFAFILLVALGVFAAQASPAAPVNFTDNFAGVTVTFPNGGTKLYPNPKNWAFTFWPGTVWPTSYGDGTNWLAGNAECQDYVTPFITWAGSSQVPANLRYDPFTIQSDGLHIRASVLTTAQQSAYQAVDYRRFGSGMLLSRFAFTYGKIRVVAKLPAARGTWPAIWLLPNSHQWPPEIDVLEGMAWSPHQNQMHSGILVPSSDTGSFNSWYSAGANLSQGFHEYGLNWNATTMTWLLDGNVVVQKPTPASMKQDMYLIINLAVGGKWVYDELGIAPVDGTSPSRLNAGDNLILKDYPSDMVVKSVTITSP